MTQQRIESRTESTAWQSLAAHAAELGTIHLRRLADARVPAPYPLALRFGPLFVNFARQRLNGRTIELLLRLCAATDVREQIRALLAGEPVNTTEHRAALHTALRAGAGEGAQGGDTMPDVKEERRRMFAFASDLAAGRVPGTGQPLATLVNIGIGGSDLGPRLVVDALHEYHRTKLRVEFVSNLDGQALFRCLDGVDPSNTLFMVASKSFTTVETLTNAGSARRWLERNGTPDPMAQFAAVTANAPGAVEFGIRPERIFHLWDWVGGRYSVWSSVGLPAAAVLGEAAFTAFLAGAGRMDLHFATAPPEQNLPVMLGLIDLWNSAFLNSPTRAIIPYDQRLQLLPAYLGQLIMESNGKSVDRQGRPLNVPSSAIVWGGIGTDAQHAFFQLLHQGTHTVPVEFLIAARPRRDLGHHQRLLAACLAQGQALMEGRTDPERPYRSTHGDQPSTTIIYDDLTPEVLGMLLALYEHRTFVHAALLGINPFDQWGVELGKEIARDIVRELERGALVRADAITRELLLHCQPFLSSAPRLD